MFYLLILKKGSLLFVIIHKLMLYLLCIVKEMRTVGERETGSRGNQNLKMMNRR